MEVRQLQYFVAAAEERSVTRAAARLFVAQPAVSRQIQVLERRLGVTLFERTARGVVLTRTGRQFLPRARAALRSIDDAVEAIRQAGAADEHTLRVGFIAEYGNGIVADLLARFRRRRPGLDVALQQFPFEDLCGGVTAGLTDVSFVDRHIDCDGLTFDTVLREPMVAVASPALLPEPPPSLTIEQFDALADVQAVPPRDGDPAYLWHFSGAASRGSLPDRTWSPRTPQELVLALGCGDSIALSTAGAVGALSRDLVLVPLVGAPPSELVLVSPTGSDSPVVAALRDFVRHERGESLARCTPPVALTAPL